MDESAHEAMVVNEIIMDGVWDERLEGVEDQMPGHDHRSSNNLEVITSDIWRV